jgi:thiamine pyrophosphokinase
MEQTPPPAVLVLHGDLSASLDVSDVSEQAYVVAIDGGLAHVRRLGLTPSVVIGDMDSVSEADLTWARHVGADIEVSPTDKDETDLELGLVHATSRHSHIVVVGGEGGTPGHLFGNLLTLASPRWIGTAVEWRIAHATVRVLHPGSPYVVSTQVDDRVSLLPVHGDAVGVTSVGLRWPLAGATLVSGQSRGVSNQTTRPPATVAVEEGTLVAITEDAA